MQRVVLIGVTSSIGGAVRERFLDTGARVLGAGSAELDLTDAASIRRFAETVRAFGPVDVLVILPGICPGKNLSNYGDDEIDTVFSVNTTGPLRLVKALLPQLARPGQVLLLSSISAERGSFDPVYAASKAALHGFVRSMAAWEMDVRFNALAPGLIEGSSMWAKMSPGGRQNHVQKTPTGRLVTIPEIAGILVGLTGPAWSSLNGQVISVDGGRW